MCESTGGSLRHGRADQMSVRLGAVATGNRDVELGVAPHAVLGHVQARLFHLRLGADADRDLEEVQDGERHREREGADGREAESLNTELVQPATVEEPALAGRELGGQLRHRQEAQRERAPHAGHAVGGDRPDGVVDPDPVDCEHAQHDDHAGDEPDQDRRPRRHERTRRGDRHERRDRAVQHHREVGLLDHEPRGHDGAEDAGRGREVRVQRDVREEADAAEVDAQRRTGVEAEPAEPEDDHAERRERHVVPGDRVRLPVFSVFSDAGSEEQSAGETSERSLIVDDGRAGEVLHAPREQPTVRAPDPVRHERVDEREEGPEREVDPQLRPLGHRAPDDRERDAAEHDLEHVPGRARNRSEPRERRLADCEQLVDRGEEARASPELVAAVAESEPEADAVVDDRRDREDQHVLRRDVADVLHPRQTGLEEREARLHEHHEHRRNDDPDRAHRNAELCVRHATPPPPASGPSGCGRRS